MHTPQAGTLSTNLVVGMDAAEEIMCARMTNTIVLPKGALVIENEANRPMVIALKGVRINMATLPRETLYVLQDEVTVEVCYREG